MFTARGCNNTLKSQFDTNQDTKLTIGFYHNILSQNKEEGLFLLLLLLSLIRHGKKLTKMYC